ncbi:muscular LMNA-interacting protein isoform X16 [Nannospalax galili]|uniref:muscular LMNA-interacting protein isoform X16 n=1 Tax=Nannospalax galili TaxID=1026970 RepID=UPI00111C2B18|nr:muscular LMNA-interacting protein isoform X16 [Nannospalax galili]
MNQCLREQGLLSACRNNYFQMNSCILAGSIQTTPKVSPGDSEAKPLLFTFVPAVRRLPTHIQLADTSKFLVKIPEEPGDKSPEAVNRFDSSDHMTFSCGSQQERGQGTLAYPSELTGRNSQGKGFETQEPQGMQQSDLFKAEYVFIVDSEGEEEATDKKGEQSPPGGTGAIADRPKSLAISSSLTSDVVRPKVRGVVLKSSSYPEASHGMAPQQKRGQALDEPAKTESISKACTIDPPVEAPTILPRAAGRETKYANLSSSSSTVSESQLTKPGVIRPVPIKSKLLLTKEEDVYEPNPFSKYLEDDSSLFSEQDVAIPHKPVSLHPLYQTKLYPPAKSLLHPQTLSHSDCLTPGPFSHLSSFSLRDEQENSPTFLSQNTYTKLGHPMVAIPEHETLDSKE